MKNLITALLLAAVTLTHAAFAAPAMAAGASLALSSGSYPALPAYAVGTIINETDKTISIKSAQTGDIIILNLGDVPRIVDCVTGQPVALKDRKDDSVAAYYGPVTTRSIPPQSNALAVICNIPRDFIPPHYAQAEAVEHADGQIKVTIDNGATIVTINRDTPIYPYLTRNIVTVDNISVGSQLLMWYPFVAQSFPGQATATQTVILGQGVASDWLSVDAKDMTDSTGFVKGRLPVFSSAAAGNFTAQLNDTVNEISSKAMQTAVNDKDKGVYFAFDAYATPQYSSIVIHTSIDPGNTSSDQVTAIVLNTMTTDDSTKYHIYTLDDLLGPNAIKLANYVITKEIAAADSGTYFTGEEAFNGLRTDPAFYVDGAGNLVIIFDKYAIAPGAAGTPAFSIPLVNVVNISFMPSDTITSNGVVMVPLRKVAESFGFTITWDTAVQSATLSKADKSYTVKIGDAGFNNEILETPPVIHNGITYVPISLVESGLGGCYLVDTEHVVVSAIK